MTMISRVGQRFQQVFRQGRHRRLIYDVANFKMAVFSDAHRGVGDGADDFKKCKDAFRTALNHYRQEDYSVMMLGDMEDLWEVSEARWRDIFQCYAPIYDVEKSLNEAGRYYRVFGNHDLAWAGKDYAKEYLHQAVGNVEMEEAFLLEIKSGADILGKIFLIHGHQGDYWSDKMKKLSKVMVRKFWAKIQKGIDVRSTKYKEGFDLETKRDMDIYYDWAVSQKQMVTVAGHTHAMVFPEGDGAGEKACALRLAAKLEARAKSRMLGAEAKRQMTAYAKLWRERIERAQQAEGKGFRPAYMNSGCASYDNGAVSVLEFVEGKARLAVWNKEGKRTEKRSQDITKIFSALGNPTKINYAKADFIPGGKDGRSA